MAGYVRRRWPQNTLAHIEREWNLTTGEARGVLYAQASRTTINKILRPKSGSIKARLKAFRLGVQLLGDVCGVAMDQYLESEAEEAANERQRWEAEERRLERLEANRRARAAHHPDLDR